MTNKPHIEGLEQEIRTLGENPSKEWQNSALKRLRDEANSPVTKSEEGRIHRGGTSAFNLLYSYCTMHKHILSMFSGAFIVLVAIGITFVADGSDPRSSFYIVDRTVESVQLSFAGMIGNKDLARTHLNHARERVQEIRDVVGIEKSKVLSFDQILFEIAYAEDGVLSEEDQEFVEELVDDYEVSMHGAQEAMVELSGKSETQADAHIVAEEILETTEQAAEDLGALMDEIEDEKVGETLSEAYDETGEVANEVIAALQETQDEDSNPKKEETEKPKDTSESEEDDEAENNQEPEASSQCRLKADMEVEKAQVKIEKAQVRIERESLKGKDTTVAEAELELALAFKAQAEAEADCSKAEKLARSARHLAQKSASSIKQKEGKGPTEDSDEEKTDSTLHVPGSDFEDAEVSEEDSTDQGTEGDDESSDNTEESEEGEGEQGEQDEEDEQDEGDDVEGVDDKKDKDVSSGISGKISICHKPGKSGGKTLSVSANAWNGHGKHGDTMGPCGGSDESSSSSLQSSQSSEANSISSEMRSSSTVSSEQASEQSSSQEHSSVASELSEQSSKSSEDSSISSTITSESSSASSVQSSSDDASSESSETQSERSATSQSSTTSEEPSDDGVGVDVDASVNANVDVETGLGIGIGKQKEKKDNKGQSQKNN